MESLLGGVGLDDGGVGVDGAGVHIVISDANKHLNFTLLWRSLSGGGDGAIEPNLMFCSYYYFSKVLFLGTPCKTGLNL